MKAITAPNGVVYRSAKAMAKAYNVSYTTFRSRRQQGHKLEECLSQSVNKFGYRITYKGITYNSITEACNDLNIAQTKVSSRMCNRHCTPIEALEYFEKKGKRC